ncbi:hypothetical protein E2C01_036884 [Portunus trituberculatus]|uniref:Uncharacterized protein n=1 Tax=Portunus trituberculatus TaxID=210409 RepID=A0A5B7F9W9_PORTR|nr:hypothetical protein [Portunus trituberculatus]
MRSTKLLGLTIGNKVTRPSTSYTSPPFRFTTNTSSNSSPPSSSTTHATGTYYPGSPSPPPQCPTLQELLPICA